MCVVRSLYIGNVAHRSDTTSTGLVVRWTVQVDGVHVLLHQPAESGTYIRHLNTNISTSGPILSLIWPWKSIEL